MRIAPDPTVHHVGGCDDVGAGTRLVQGLAHERFDRLVVENAELSRGALAHKAVMAVAGIGVERDVGDEAEARELPLDRAAGFAHQIAFVEGLAAALVLEMRLGIREERDRRNVELDRPLGLAQNLVGAEPVDAGHRGDRNAPRLAVYKEQRPDESRSSSAHAPRPAAAPIPPCGCGVGAGSGSRRWDAATRDGFFMAAGSSPISYTDAEGPREGLEADSERHDIVRLTKQ